MRSIVRRSIQLRVGGMRLINPQRSSFSALMLLVMLCAGMVAFVDNQITYAATTTAILVPNADVTTNWPTIGGASDGSCAAGGHCNYVDDGLTDNTNDYISTSGSMTGGEVEEYALTSSAGIATASQVVLRVYAMSTTNANGGTLDTLTLNLRVNGTLQTAVTTCTPAYNAWTACTATFTGSWTQSDVDSMQAYVQRVAQGSGSTSKKVDTIQLANVYSTLTYTPAISMTQSAYRWFGNQDTAGPITFISMYKGSNTDVGKSIVKTNDGGYAVTGYTSSYGAGSDDMFLAKYSNTGILQWEKTWGGTGSDVGTSLVQTSDGGYAVTGSTTSYGYGSEMMIVKYDSTGALQWSDTWGTVDDDAGNAIAQASDGSYAVTGYAAEPHGTTNSVLFLQTFSSTGTPGITTEWGGSGGNVGNAIVRTSDGGYAVAGSTSSYGAGGNDALLIKFDSSGAVSWNVTWGKTGDDAANSLIQTSDGGYALTGFTTINDSNGADDMVLMKYDNSGALQWNKVWGGAGYIDVGEAIIQTDDGGYAVAGGTTSTDVDANSDALLVKYDSGGTLLWSKSWGVSGGDEMGYSLIQTSDSGYAMTGSENTNGPGTFLARYDSSGNISGCGSICSSPPNTLSTPTATVTTPTATVTSPTEGISPQVITPGTAAPAMTGIVSIANSSISVGSPLAAQDTAITSPGDGVIFRLRLDLHVSGIQADQNALGLKLQYAKPGGSTCNSPPLPIYNDVTDSTVIRYANNPNAVNGMRLTTSANDPVHGTDTTVPQQYLEAGTGSFVNTSAIPVGQDGMWDFALTTQGATPGTRYCFQVVNSDNSSLSAYNIYPQITIPTPTQGVSIVDGSGATVASPSYPLSSLYMVPSCQTATGAFGTSSQRLRINGGSVGNGFSVSIAPTGGATALWNDTAGHSYDFNDSSGSPAGCNSGSDGDGYAGQLTIDPSAATITPQSGCTSTGLGLGSAAGYSSGATDSITLLTGSSSAPPNCYWDVTGAGMSQTVPPSQPAGQYMLDMTVTMVAS